MTNSILKFLIIYFFLIKLITADQIGHLSDLKWKKRIIIITDDENFNFNKRIKKYQKEIEEREISIIFFNKNIAYLDNKIISKKFSNSVGNKIKNKNPYHRLILIGKDGGVKNSYLFETELGKIFYDVDKMPMRRYEVKKRNSIESDYIFK